MISPDLQDIFQRDRQAAQEQAAAGERARANNIKTFTTMWLSLGSDVLKLDGSRHDQELAEARGLAMNRWGALLGMESQVERDAGALETRPKKRPAQNGDERIPDRTIAEWEASWDEQTKHMHAALGELRRLAERERLELESLTQRR